ncbi:MAG TPA: 16S rRNA (adenine(1518)-N(6)/adenine(1519)-N(6))-dimethyltransferase RsmA [Dehalococcoidia bacterium]
MESHLTARRVGSTSTSSRTRAGRPRQSAPARARPRKALGQHFLSDPNILNRIVDAADLAAGDRVLEIGAGPGELTSVLAERGFAVTAVELDRGLTEGLRRRFASSANVVVVEADGLHLETKALFGGEQFAVVANLPYNAGTAMVRRLLESEAKPRRLVVLLQKEVALAMVAPPGQMSLMGLGVQVYAAGRKLFDVPPGAFYPPPKVMSSVILLDVLPEPRVPEPEIARFFAVARAGFSAPRKQLHNALMNGLGLPADAIAMALRLAGIDPAVRPRELSVEQWLALSRAVRG